jgi:hypothetical protein
MKKMKAFIAAVVFLAASFSFVLFSPPVSAACTDTALLIPAWYRGLQDGSCTFKAKTGPDGVRNTAIKIGLNLLQGGMVIGGYAAVIFIIKGGFNYIYSAGSPDGMASAKKTLTNAIVGLVIVVLAASIINVVAGLI